MAESGEKLAEEVLVAEAEAAQDDRQDKGEENLEDAAMDEGGPGEDDQKDGNQEDEESKEQTLDLEGKPEDAIPEEDADGDGDDAEHAEHVEDDAEKDAKETDKSVVDPTQRPPHGSEVFVGGITPETTEDDLRTLCSPIGEIFEVRILKDKLTGTNKGFSFVTFMNKESAQKAIATLNGMDMKGKKVRVSNSQPKNRLFVGNIPKAWEKEDLEKILADEGQGIVGIELLKDPKNPARNRGFAFVEYYNHACAERARRNLSKPNFKLANNVPTISWAEPRPEPDASAMSTVKVLYVKGIPEGTTEDQLKQLFSKYGEITRIMLPTPKPGQPKRDFGFVHFAERSQALKAVEKNEKFELSGKVLDVSLAKPPAEKRGPPQEQYSSGYRSGASHAYSQAPHRGGGGGGGGGGSVGGYAYAPATSYAQYDSYRGGYERQVAAAPAPLVYGRAPAGMTMVPMVLPDGRLGYVFQPSATEGGSSAPASYREEGRGGASRGASYQNTGNPARRYRPY